MIKSDYVPHKKDIMYLDFDPQSGVEIKKRRPAIVLSNENYNRRTGLVVVSPVTHTRKNKISSIKIGGRKIDGYVNALQFYTFDFRARDAQYIEKASNRVYYKVMNVIKQIF